MDTDTDIEGDTLIEEINLDDDDDDRNDESTSSTSADVYDIFYNELFNSDDARSSISGAHSLLEAINRLEIECRKPNIRKIIKSFTKSRNLGDIDSLIPYVKTRWTYSVLSFERLLLLAPCLLNLMKEGMLSPLLDESDIECIKVYIVLLKPFQTITSFFNSPETTSRYLLSALRSYKDTVLPHVWKLRSKLNKKQMQNRNNDSRLTIILTQIERFLSKIKEYIESYEKEQLLVVASYFNCGYRNSPYLMEKLGLKYEEGNNKSNNDALSKRISDIITGILFPMLNIRLETTNENMARPRIPGIMSIVFDDGSESIDNQGVSESHFQYIFYSMVLKEVQSFNSQYNKIHVRYTEEHMKEIGTEYDQATGMFKLSNGNLLSEYEYLLLTMRDVHHKIWEDIRNCPILTLFNQIIDSVAVSSTHIEHIFSISSILTSKRRGRILPSSLEKRMKTKVAYMTLGNYHKFDLKKTTLDQILFVQKSESQ